MEIEPFEEMKSDKNAFSYDKLFSMLKNKDSEIASNGYIAYIDPYADKNFVILEKCNNNVTKDKQFASTVSSGIKIHIAIADINNDDRNLHRAWDFFAEFVVKNGIKKVKIIKNEARNEMRNTEKAGKEITWYLFKDDLTSEKTEKILNDLTKYFVILGINPGQCAKHDDGIVKGSNYFSFRNDKKIVNVTITFEALEVKVLDQPQRYIYPIQEKDKNDENDKDENENENSAPKRIIMDDSAANPFKEYNEDDDSDDDSCCSRFCR